ncbi:hypothetical protein [Jannaschia helgolandensis]|uniref:Uncharacterized protein n=1 Tax=Jannaschia helgolandensis TaxID=188906 RepID=A0A1H7P3J3_9RHOB|nr:hypothetical protein [Jannaschia helgolandensis]SEL30014.1 hypothetical protein SAMN04488526_2395 [Jannaschia helgolandensis]
MPKPEVTHAQRVVDMLQETDGALTHLGVADNVLRCTSFAAREVVKELIRRGLINPKDPTHG